MSLVTPNDTITRTLDIINPNGSGDLRMIEGLQIAGRVILSYDSSSGTVSVGIVGHRSYGPVGIRWRKRK